MNIFAYKSKLYYRKLGYKQEFKAFHDYGSREGMAGHFSQNIFSFQIFVKYVKQSNNWTHNSLII